MQRSCLKSLEDWLKSPDRKPLIIRGARQVGKTWSIRQLAKLSGRRLVELNFENRPELASLFSTNDVNQIVIELNAYFKHHITADNSLLFMDEIQAAPDLIAKLRWFAEDLPELPVIAAGSLLEFVLDDHTFSMPVGRVSYMHLEPLSFQEFLLARNNNQIVDYLSAFNYPNKIPEAIHLKLTQLFKEYIVVGGMPAVVKNWCQHQSLQLVNQTQHDLLATYRDDFSKYKTRISSSVLDETMLSVPRQLGHKFTYSEVKQELKSQAIKQAIHLLNKSRVCSPITYSASNGVPIGAEINEKYFKQILVDVGLCSASLGLDLNKINQTDDITLINSGGIAEQVTGQLLRTIFPSYIEPKLYYWQRIEKGAEAEVDYVIQHKNLVIPIEVKAGTTGSLKSLHIFMGLKSQRDVAVRINSDYPSITSVNMTNQMGNKVNYNLVSIPFYLVSELHRLLDTIIN